eukprot:TRINITY_DN16292_c0_g1_i1.p1 TRINITY_DN16292_c0_g1~~TRINITY_DN16292_c0_g1_i1.p1  ORF type:complete len:1859 (+),score=529.61 TRINITY_DN16292_c0_g1_i1:234-5579(+)
MVDKDITPNFQDSDGRFALHVGVETCNFELVKILMKHPRLTANSRLKETGVTPLIAACKDIKTQSDKLQMVKLLLRIPSIDLNLRDNAGFTALCYSVTLGDIQLVTTLVESKADINLGPEIDGKVNGPLFYAKQAKKQDIEKYLESKGAGEHPVPSQHKVSAGTRTRPVTEYQKSSSAIMEKQRARAREIQPVDKKGKIHAHSCQVPKGSSETTGQITEPRRKLLESIQHEDINQLKGLLDGGTDPNFYDESGQTPLLIAIEKINPELVKVLLNYVHINVNLPDELTGTYPIIAAAKNFGVERLKIVNLLLTVKDIEVNVQDKDGYSALTYACIFGDLSVAKVLVAAGADVNLGNEKKLQYDYIETPLYHARINNHPTLVQFLEANGGEESEMPDDGEETENSVATATPKGVTVLPKLVVPEDDKDNTKWNRSLLLLKAKAQDSSQVQKLLFEKGVDPNFMDEEDKTCLLVAIESRYLNIIKLILQSPKLNINLKNEFNGEAPLHFAVKQQATNKTEIIKLLLQCEGIHINIQDNEGRTPLYCAAELGDIDTCKVFLECGADWKLSKQSVNGSAESPLDVAKKGNHAQVVSLLQSVVVAIKRTEENGIAAKKRSVEITPKSNSKENENDTAYYRSLLLIKVKQSDLKTVRTFLDKGVSPNFINDDGETALGISIEKKNINMLKLLLSTNRIDPNLCDPDFGEPPIISAIRLPKSPERLEIIQLILQTPGIQLTVPLTASGITPVSVANELGDKEVLALLTDFTNPKTIEKPHRVPLTNRSLTAPKNSIQKVNLNTSANVLPASGPTKPKVSPSSSPLPSREVVAGGLSSSAHSPSKHAEKQEVKKNEDTKWNRSLLLINVKKGDNLQIKKLLEKGVSPNFVDEEGETPLLVAISTNNLDAVKLLLSSEIQKIDINLSDEMTGLTPLMCAVQNKGPKRIEITKLLLQTPGININAQDEEGSTALVIASKSGDVELAKLLIDFGAEINLARSESETPLQIAMISNNKELSQLLSNRSSSETLPRFEPEREKYLRQSLFVLRETSKRNLLPGIELVQPQKPFSDKVFVKVPIRDPVKDIIVGRGWKRFKYEENATKTALLCFDINTQLEVPDLNISFQSVVRTEKCDMYNEPNKFVFLVIPLKFQIAATTEKGREIWMKIIRHFCKELQVKASPQIPREESRNLNAHKLNFTQTDYYDKLSLLQKISIGDIKEVTLLIEKSISVNFVHNGNTPLKSAIQNGNMDIVKVLLSLGRADVNLKDDKGMTPLLHAVLHPEKSSQLVPLLLNTQGLSINEPDKNEQSPLHHAILNGNLEIATSLINAKANISMGKKEGNVTRNAIYFAQLNNTPQKKAIISLLLENGATLPTNATQLQSDAKVGSPQLSELDTRQNTIMNYVSIGNWQALVEICLRQQFSANFRDSQGRTPLTLAVENSDRNITRVLLKTPKIDVNITDKDGHTPLIKSITGNKGAERNKIIDHLSQAAGISLDFQDPEGKTALIHAVICGDLDAAKLLINAKANLSVGKKEGEILQGPLYYAKLNNRVDFLKYFEEEVSGSTSPNPLTYSGSSEYNKKLFLLNVRKSDLLGVAELIKKGVDPNYIERTTGHTSLQIAIENQNINMLRLLMKSPLLNVNIQFGEVLCTPLIFICKQKTGRVEMARILLHPRDVGSKVDVNVLDKNTRSALTYAAFYGDYDLVKLLIDCTANVNPSMDSANTETPLFYARRKGHNKVIDLLLENGAAERESKSSYVVEDSLSQKNISRRYMRSKNLDRSASMPKSPPNFN